MEDLQIFEHSFTGPRGGLAIVKENGWFWLVTAEASVACTYGFFSFHIDIQAVKLNFNPIRDVFPTRKSNIEESWMVEEGSETTRADVSIRGTLIYDLCSRGVCYYHS